MSLVVDNQQIDYPAPFQPGWYALYTCSRHEKQVARHLDSRQVTNLLPLYESVRRWKDRKVRLELPLFPGYLFVHIPFEQRIKVLTIPGAVSLVGANGCALPVPVEDVERLRNGMRDGVSMMPHPFLTAGRCVRIRRGPFAGGVGFLLRKKGVFRVVISFDLIKQSMALELDACDIEPIG
jgi:transcription antitermination factor NusG